MKQLLEVVVGLNIALALVVAGSSLAGHADSIDGTSSIREIQLMLAGIYEERSFNTILLVHPLSRTDSTHDAISQLDSPMVVMTPGQSFEFIRKFNAEIIAVIIMLDYFDGGLLATAAQSLNYMRQVRIVVVAVNILSAEQAHVRGEILEMCEAYKMTRVILVFRNSKPEMDLQYLQLNPYPQYNWTWMGGQTTNGIYYGKHWKNFQNKTVWTYTAQTSPRAFFFMDSQGKLKLNGYVARLVMLFGERFNASLRMYKPLDMKESVRLNEIHKLVADNLLDIPMVVDTGNDGKWQQRTDVVDFVQIKLMVPCSRIKTKRQIYGILLNWNFIGCVSICTLIFSILHTFVDYLLYGIVQRVNLVLSDKIWPGVLGQSFSARKAPRLTLKVIYILLFFTGLNISIQFSTKMNTLFTRPPYERRIESYDDFNKSPLRVLQDSPDSAIPVNLISKPILFLNNSKLFREYRQNFNTSFAYFVSSSSWRVFSRKQQYFSRKVFCTHDNLTIYSSQPWAILLQEHSEYREPLNYLIHRALDLGLMEAWHADTFGDMLKTKEISILDPNPTIGYRDLTANDLYWIWLVMAVGWTISSLVFLMELWIAHRTRRAECLCLRRLLTKYK